MPRTTKKLQPVKYKGFSVGDNITVLSRPTMWSSRFSTKCPTSSNIKYPLDIRIEKLSEDYEGDMLCSLGYGWSLSGLVKSDLVIKNVQNKINEFPTNGWCVSPSEEVVEYVQTNFNDGVPIPVGLRGIAWNGRSAWKIATYSNYPKYDNKYLKKLLPKKQPPFVVVDNDLGKSSYQQKILSSYLANTGGKVNLQKPILRKNKNKTKRKLILNTNI